MIRLHVIISKTAKWIITYIYNINVNFHGSLSVSNPSTFLGIEMNIARVFILEH